MKSLPFNALPIGSNASTVQLKLVELFIQSDPLLVANANENESADVQTSGNEMESDDFFEDQENLTRWYYSLATYPRTCPLCRMQFSDGFGEWCSRECGAYNTLFTNEQIQKGIQPGVYPWWAFTQWFYKKKFPFEW